MTSICEIYIKNKQHNRAFYIKRIDFFYDCLSFSYFYSAFSCAIFQISLKVFVKKRTKFLRVLCRKKIWAS